MFFLENLLDLFRNLSIVPNRNDSIEEQFNSITRLCILVFFVLNIFKYNESVMFLLMSILIIIISYYIQRNMTSCMENSNFLNTATYQGSGLVRNEIPSTDYMCAKSTLASYGPEFVSLNQKLAGLGAGYSSRKKHEVVQINPIFSDGWRQELKEFPIEPISDIGCDDCGYEEDCELVASEPQFVFDQDDPVCSSNMGISMAYQPKESNERRNVKRGGYSNMGSGYGSLDRTTSYKTMGDFEEKKEMSRRGPRDIYFGNNIPICQQMNNSDVSNMNNFRCKANNIRHQNEMDFRTDMQERLMAKQHNISEQRKLFPLRRDSAWNMKG